MCGIAGIINKNGEAADPAILKRMAESMKLRGPDGEGFFVQNEVGLAHRRLSILDLQGGAQPLYNEDRSIVFVHNGEIYNHHQLRKKLEDRGHVFRTRSDSECIGHLYEEYGMDFPKYLDGMFAIALADLKKKTLILVTDRAGKKPVFYFNLPHVFAFASTLPALAKHPDMPRHLNLQGIWDYMTYLYIPMPSTLYRHVHKIPPGYLMALSPEMDYPDLRRWWKPDFSVKAAKDFNVSAQNLRRAVIRAVKSRLESDVPLGVFLSGGLDSAIVASVVSRVKSPEPLRCFSIGFHHAAYDESALARAHGEFIRSHAARKVELHEKIVTPEDFSALEFLCSAYGEPFADASILPTYLLCKFARESVTVALSGDGADELFGGYERYHALQILSRFQKIPEFARKSLYQNFCRVADSSAGERTFSGRFRRFLQAAQVPASHQYPELLSKCSYSMKKNIFGAAFSDFNPGRTIRLWNDWRRSATAVGRVECAMEYDLASYLPNDILTKMDTASMNASLEVRSPFLDRRVMELASAMPLSYKLRGKHRKYILGEAFKDMLPPGIQNLKKRGFGVPVSDWLRGPWKQQMEENLLEGLAATVYEIFRRDTAEYMIAEHCAGRADFGYQLFMLLTLELSLHKV